MVGDRGFMRQPYRSASCIGLLGVLLFLSFKPASAILSMARLAEERRNGTSGVDDHLLPKWRKVRPTRQQLNDTPRPERIIQRQVARQPSILPTILAGIADSAVRPPDRPHLIAASEGATPAYLKTYRPGGAHSSLAPPT